MPGFTSCRRLAFRAGLAMALPIAAAGAALAAGPMVPTRPSPTQPAAALAPEPQNAAASASPAAAPAAASQAPIAVSAWGFSQTSPTAANAPTLVSATTHRPLYLWMTLAGGQAAIDRLRSGQHLAVAVHWTNENPGSAARGLTKELDVANPGLAATLQGEVAKDGHFNWHSWARKDALSPGRWTVSLTTPDGQPILCGQPADQPCRLSIDVS